MKLGIIGYRGKMGSAILQEAEKQGIKVAALHSRNHDSNPLVTNSLEELVDKVDVIIDFSRPETSLALAKLALKQNKAYLCGTTGLNHSQLELLKEVGKKTKVFYSANMSLGVAILTRLAQEAIKAFQKYDLSPEVLILERHHKEKVDQPSGTAMALANKIKTNRDLAVKDIVSLRYGSLIGEHELIISNNLEVLSLKHEAMDRKLFASGSLKAANFLFKQDLPGFYTMDDIFDF